jgi:hypothetical protein
MLLAEPETVGISSRKTGIVRNQTPFIDVKLFLNAANTERHYIFRIKNDSQTIKSFMQAYDEADRIDKTIFTWPAYSTTVLGIFLRYGFAPER